MVETLARFPSPQVRDLRIGQPACHHQLVLRRSGQPRRASALGLGEDEPVNCLLDLGDLVEEGGV
ncbi:hypothetical protein, partial [Streptomyces sp. NPDC058291]|uniref:hypothetical protein n=1 Tax=Streptomyces sp. NPDC058291 TaxID=3346427 RepID=UPI0036F1758F